MTTHDGTIAGLFADPDWTYNGIHIQEWGHDSELLITTGHIPPRQYVAALTEWARRERRNVTLDPADVRHHTAVLVACPNPDYCECEGEGPHVEYTRDGAGESITVLDLDAS